MPNPEHAGLVALTGMSASPQLMHATEGALSAGVTIGQILIAIYNHKDDIIAAYNAIMNLWRAINPAAPPAPVPTGP